MTIEVIRTTMAREPGAGYREYDAGKRYDLSPRLEAQAVQEGWASKVHPADASLGAVESETPELENAAVPAEAIAESEQPAPAKRGKAGKK